jgi:hypothetical protein
MLGNKIKQPLSYLIRGRKKKQRKKLITKTTVMALDNIEKLLEKCDNGETTSKKSNS